LLFAHEIVGKTALGLLGRIGALVTSTPASGFESLLFCTSATAGRTFPVRAAGQSFTFPRS
jgi:hypothetical protein